jgi:flagellar basal-body rod protein FlgC
MGLLQALKLGRSGMDVQRARMEAVASNLANVSTTRSARGGPYQRRAVIVSDRPVREGSFRRVLDRNLRAATIDRIAVDGRPPLLRHEPGHPDAGPDGYVAYPNVNPAEEMVDMVSATRSYQANVAVIRSVRAMLRAALDLIR